MSERGKVLICGLSVLICGLALYLSFLMLIEWLAAQGRL